MRWMTGASQEPPPLTTLGPLGKGGALCNRRSTAVPVGPPRPSSITHPEVAPATVTCSYIEAGAGLGLGRTTRRQSAPLFEMMGRVEFDARIFFPWMAGHPCPTLRVRGPFPSKEIRRISVMDVPGPPVVPGGLGIGLGSHTLERAGR